jgi:hypothetical protein
VGARLAFAAGALAPLTHVSLELQGPAGATRQDFPVEGRPGKETPLDLTPLLDTSGPVLIRAGFGDSADAARAALDGRGPEGAVVLRQRLEVRP